MQFLIKKTVFLSFFLSCFFFSATLFAQKNNPKKGKADTKKWKAEISKAKKGNSKSILFVISLYRGDMLAPDAIKDYKKATKWLSKIETTKGKIAQQKNRELFLIHLTGGFGVGKNKSAAKRDLAKYCKENQELLSYQDKSDLDLCDFFDIKADKPKNKMLLGRYYLEFGLSYAIGQYWLNIAARGGNVDAKYLREKWTLLKKSYKQKVNQEKLQGLMLKYAELGSQIAALEYVSLTSNTAKKLKKEQAEKLLKPSMDSENTELKFKANLLFLPFLKGKEYIAALRQVSLLQAKVSKNNAKLAEKAILELQNIDTKIKTVSDLSTFGKARKLTDLAFDERAYQNSFGGNYQELIYLYFKFASKENIAFIGEQNLANYRKEIQEKLTKILQKQKKMSLLIANFSALSSAKNLSLIPKEKLAIYKDVFNKKAIQIIQNTANVNSIFDDYSQIYSGIKAKKIKGIDLKSYDGVLTKKVNLILNSEDIKLLAYLNSAFEINSNARHILPNYQTVISEKLKSLRARKGDIRYYELEYTLNNQYFGTFAKAESFYNVLNSERTVSYSKRMALIDALRQKTINDIYGNNPTAEFIAKTKSAFSAQKWLKGAGKDLISSKLVNFQKTKIEQTTFKTLAQGQQFYHKIQKEAIFDYAQKKMLTTKLSRTVIQNIYGQRPFGKKLLAGKRAVFAASWLNPEGRQVFLTYLFEYFDKQVKSTKFTTLAEARNLYNSINSESNLIYSQKQKLLPIIRKKALNDVYGTSPSNENIIKIGKLLNQNSWLSPEGYQVYSGYARQAFMDKIQNSKFRSLGQARNFNNDIKGNRAFSWGDKKKLSDFLKRKAIADVYGKYPRPKQIQKFHQDLNRNSWLNPEGEKLYLELLNNSKYSFSKTVFSSNGSKTYHYKAEIKKDSDNEYKIEVKEIRAGRTSLAYSSAAVIALEGDTYVVKIFIANLKGGFRWVLARNDYLKVKYKKNNSYLEAEAFHNMKKHASYNSYGYSEKELRRKSKANEFSEKAALGDALKYFIFSYNRLMQ